VYRNVNAKSLALNVKNMENKILTVFSLLIFFPLQAALTAGQTVALRETQRLVSGTPVERMLRGGEVHSYQVPLTVGQFLRVIVEQRGIDVVVAAFKPDGTKISEVDSPNGTQGPEPVSIAAETSGDHRIEVRSLEANAAPGRYEIKIEELLSAVQYRARLADERARDEAVITRLRSQPIPLRDLTAGSGFADLMPLKEILRDVRVVGLGEATHGTREFFQIKHRLLEFLVREMGFTVLAMEASYSAAMNVNDYVLHRRNDRAAALAGLKAIWISDTEEIVQMIDWMREYNRKVPEERKVKFFGFDPQMNAIAVEVVTAYLRRVAPDRAPDAEATFQRILLEDTKANNFQPTEVPTAQLSELYRLISYFVLNKADFISRTSAQEFERAMQHLRLLAQFAEFNSPSPFDGSGTRDRYMAENFQYIVNAEKPGSRFIVWAHNAHVSKRDTGNFPPMGSYLRRTFGDGYYAFGFAFNQGAFQAQVAGEASVRVQEFTLRPAPEKTVDWYLARTRVGNFIIDFRRLSNDEMVSQWLQATRRMHFVGAIFSDRWTEAQWTQPFVLNRDFDGLIFIERTNRARPTVTARREGSPD
jgi:erythromycin esterase